MADNYDQPTGFFPNAGQKSDRYVNPFYGIPLQYLPLNIDHMFWWADHFLLRFGFYRAALLRIANYFITSISIDSDDSDYKKKYEEAFETLKWKEKLGMLGLNLLAYSNVFMSVSQGFDRFLKCPKCNNIVRIDKFKKYKFDGKLTYSGKCQKRGCNHNGKLECIDKPSTNIDKITTVFWNPREMRVKYEETTGKMDYYWDYPSNYVAKVSRPNDRFYAQVTPRVIYEAIAAKKLINLHDSTFLHIKLPTPAGVKTDGRAVPLSIYMFDDFFMLKVLQRFNEAICFEDINPFRVLALATESGGAANPVLTQNSTTWKREVANMIQEHRLDPGAYHTFPFPLNYQQLGGQGKNLAPTEMIAQSIQGILNALNIPQELYTMNMQYQAIGPALRLFENSWSCMVDAYNTFLQHQADVLSKTKGWPEAKVRLIPVTLSDDMERKSMIAQLVASNSIAKSELLGLYNFDWREQVRKKIQEERDVKELQEEEQIKEQLNDAKRMKDTGQQPQGQAQQGGVDTSTANMSPGDVIQKAQEIAQQLFPMDGAARRTQLQQIKATNETLYSQVKQELDKLTSQSKSQGLQQSKQQPPQQQ